MEKFMQGVSRLARYFVFAAVCLAFTACGGKSSTTGNQGGPILTSSMHMDLSVKAWTSDNVDVHVILNEHGGADNKIELDGGDYLSFCVATQCTTLRPLRAMFGTITGYASAVPVTSSGPYVLSLYRASGVGNATGTQVSIPTAFQVVSPVLDQQFSDGENVVLAWTPVSTVDATTIDTDVDCTYVNGNSLPSTPAPVTDTGYTGTLSFLVEDLIAYARTPPAPMLPSSIDRCSLNFWFKQQRTGTVDPAFAGGSAVGEFDAHTQASYVAPR
jgi:hypothetical protein